jgi:hypothetical protein
MAAASLVTVHLGMAASDIAGARQRLTEIKTTLTATIQRLDGIPSKFADMITTVNTPGYGVDAFTNSNVAQLAALSAEFVELNNAAKALQSWINGNVTEF